MKLIFTFVMVVLIHFGASAQYRDERGGERGIITGVVLSEDEGVAVQFASVSLEGLGGYGTTSDENGRFQFRAPVGEQTLVVSFVGYESSKQKVDVKLRQTIEVDVKLKSSATKIESVIVRGDSQSSKINKTAFNVEAIAIEDMKNTTASLTDVLSKASGVRIRESGGVGSDTKISLNGFSGSQVKIFVDGILQTGNSAFSLNNIPANYAERIEVYNGVAPIEFGTDALGGIINIVSKKQNHVGWDLDASYSYGSFNTHRSNLTFTHQLDNGLQYKVNAYQNYSDNNYEIDNTVIMFTGTNTSYTTTDIYTVERFNDTYHNEAVIAEMGVRGKKWADVATFSLNYAQFYKEVQTGTRQSVVYGDRHQEGLSLIPTVQFSKRDIFTKGLDVKANANYNYGETYVIDTTVYNYNWLQDTQKTGSRSYTYNQSKTNSWNVNGSSTYKPHESHILSMSYTITSSARVTRSADRDYFYDWEDPQYTTKSVTGLSYMYKLGEKFNAQAFGKYYTQSNDGVTYDEEGVRSERNEKNGYLGYGVAATGMFLNGFQSKISYEKSYRLPTTTELFGDNDLELGNVTLNPENSDNYNVSLTYNRAFGKHSIQAGGGVIYCDTKDFIRRVVSTDGETASSVNHGKVETKGWNASVRYEYYKFFSVGARFNTLNARDNEAIDVTTGYASLTYGQRMPNEPYMDASVDGRINLYDLIMKKDHFYVVYDLFYQHEFPLYWEAFGEKETKKYVPTQWSHTITLNYVIKDGKYNFSLECRNLTDAKIYDNFSLQKAGRAFYGKVRINIGSVSNKKK
ncbi:MAG: TonB-dependent receptor [Rikenellaceae bacterium]